MKILFVCGSIEEGKDGVGDYVRRLSLELVKSGIEVNVIAINDHHIDEVKNEVFEQDDLVLTVHRFPAGVSFHYRMKQCKVLIDNFNPNWISLQYVPYSYNVKGLPFKLNMSLMRWKNAYNWQITFHELWLDEPVNFKQQLISKIQVFLIRNLVKALKCRKVVVTNKFNQERLARLSFPSYILPLFGNIDGKNLGLEDLNGPKHSCFSILYFGSPPREPFRSALINELKGFLEVYQKPIAIAVVSGNSSTKDTFVRQLNDNLNTYNVQVDDYGFVSQQTVSKLMRKCSVGIARSEPHLLGKSGSAIAMLEHGLPIWLPKWNSQQAINFAFRKELIFKNLVSASGFRDRPGYESLLPSVSNQFIEYLKKN